MNKTACFGFPVLFITLVGFVSFEKWWQNHPLSLVQQNDSKKGAHLDGGVPASPSLYSSYISLS